MRAPHAIITGIMGAWALCGAAFGAAMDWEARGYTSSVSTNEESLAYRLTSAGGGEAFSVQAKEPIDEDQGRTIAGLASNFFSWKGLKIQSLRFLVDDQIRILLSPSTFTNGKTDLLAAMPSGMTFTYADRLSYKIQLRTAGASFSFQGNFWGENRFLAELKAAVDDPLAYTRRNDAAFLAGRLGAMGESNAQLEVQWQSLSAERRALLRQVSNLSTDLAIEQKRTGSATAESLSDRWTRGTNGKLRVQRALRHEIGYARGVILSPMGTYDPYFPGQRDSLFWEAHGLFGLPVYAGLRMSGVFFLPATNTFGSSYMLEPGVSVGVTMATPAARGLDFSFSGGMGYLHYVSFHEFMGTVATTYNPVMTAALRGEFLVRGRAFIGLEAEYRLILESKPLHDLAFGLRVGAVLAKSSSPEEPWIHPSGSHFPGTNAGAAIPGKLGPWRDVIAAVGAGLMGAGIADGVVWGESTQDQATASAWSSVLPFGLGLVTGLWTVGDPFKNWRRLEQGAKPRGALKTSLGLTAMTFVGAGAMLSVQSLLWADIRNVRQAAYQNNTDPLLFDGLYSNSLSAHNRYQGYGIGAVACVGAGVITGILYFVLPEAKANVRGTIFPILGPDRLGLAWRREY